MRIASPSGALLMIPQLMALTVEMAVLILMAHPIKNGSRIVILPNVSIQGRYFSKIVND